jgi:hypothetical protein
MENKQDGITEKMVGLARDIHRASNRGTAVTFPLQGRLASFRRLALKMHKRGFIRVDLNGGQGVILGLTAKGRERLLDEA